MVIFIKFCISNSVNPDKHGKNSFAEISKNLARFENTFVIDHQNNYNYIEA